MTARRDGEFGFEWQIELTVTAQETVATDSTLAWGWTKPGLAAGGRLDGVGIMRTNPVSEACNSLPHVKPVVARSGSSASMSIARWTRSPMKPNDIE